MRRLIIAMVFLCVVCLSVNAEIRNEEYWVSRSLMIAEEMEGDKVYEEWVDGCHKWLYAERMKEFNAGIYVYGKTPEEIRTNFYDYCCWHTYNNFKYLEEYRPDNGGYLFKGYYRPGREEL